MRRDLIEDARLCPAAIEAGSSETAARVNGLLPKLGVSTPNLIAIVELKYFLGLPDDECADVLGVPVRTVQRQWQDARRWLYERVESQATEVSC